MRFCTVLRTPPIRPGILFPGQILPGSPPPPVAPIFRCVLLVPCEAGCPFIPCRFMTPWKPLPILHAHGGWGGVGWYTALHMWCVCAVVCEGQSQTHVVAHTSTYCPTVKWAAVMGVPTGNNALLVTLNSHSFRFRGVPALAKWPRSGPDTYTHTHTPSTTE